MGMHRVSRVIVFMYNNDERNKVVAILTDLGHEVFVARSFSELKEGLTSQIHTDLDKKANLVIADFRESDSAKFPVGPSIAEFVRKIGGRKIKMILASNWLSDSAIAEGADFFLEKPVRKDTLNRAMEKIGCM